MRLRERLSALLGLAGRARTERRPHRGPTTHVIVLDGTMSTLDRGQRTNAGRLYALLQEVGARANLSFHYEAGLQWGDRRLPLDMLVGRGINRQMGRAYGVLASRFRPGDSIVLAGYSRGAFAVRSLAGVVDRVGLLRHDCATERMVRQAYRHYRCASDAPVVAAFRKAYCHDRAEIEALAVWDTVNPPYSSDRPWKGPAAPDRGDVAVR
ncbi:MAG: protein of unknown function (DUF2235) [Rhodobacteraceae bacterium HLUCCA08]|nr:MAG: protein of unknown function (DUF2235) [Rhodobacteraceae bacterium HLUCCA08]